MQRLPGKCELAILAPVRRPANAFRLERTAGLASASLLFRCTWSQPPLEQPRPSRSQSSGSYKPTVTRLLSHFPGCDRDSIRVHLLYESPSTFQVWIEPSWLQQAPAASSPASATINFRQAVYCQERRDPSEARSSKHPACSLRRPGLEPSGGLRFRGSDMHCVGI